MPYVLGILGILFLLVIVLIIIVAMRSAEFRIERRAQMAAPPSAVFALLNDFHQWGRWSPWEHLDPTMRKTFEGAPAGKGAIYSWAGNKKAGEGRMTILETTPNEIIVLKLEFLKPFATTNQTTFRLSPAQGGTQVTWAMEGKKNFVMKGFSLFMDMDQMVGKDFEQGLANLSAVTQGNIK